MNNLIGISGKIGSGKDTVGKILQYLNCSPPSVDKIDHMMKFITDDKYKSNLDIASNYKIKKYADKLKDIVCLLISCTREQLEDREFKEKELGEEWWYWKNSLGKVVSYLDNKTYNRELIKLTPRKLLQLLGTDCGRDIIHPQIWVNALFADYDNRVLTPESEKTLYKNNNNKWIITDVRFENEAQAIKDRGGVVIRVNRKQVEHYMPLKWYQDLHEHNMLNGDIKDIEKTFHSSETSLDNYEFDHVIENNGSIEELVKKVKQLKLV